MAGVQFWPEIRGLDHTLVEKIDQFRQLVPVFTNVIYDTSENVTIKLPAAEIESKRFQTLALRSLGEGGLETDRWIDAQPEVQIDGDVATLIFDLQVPTLKTAFILIR